MQRNSCTSILGIERKNGTHGGVDIQHEFRESDPRTRSRKTRLRLLVPVGKVLDVDGKEDSTKEYPKFGRYPQGQG
jgi:hypothetical protein